MKNQRRHVIRIALSLFGLAALGSMAVAQDAAQDKAREARSRRGTVQSELDYLKSAQVPISIELTQVTIQQAYDKIAGKAGLNVAYEGTLNGGGKHDLSFKHKTVKEVFEKLGTKYGLTYRVDGPDRLTVIGSAAS